MKAVKIMGAGLFLAAGVCAGASLPNAKYEKPLEKISAHEYYSALGSGNISFSQPDGKCPSEERFSDENLEEAAYWGGKFSKFLMQERESRTRSHHLTVIDEYAQHAILFPPAIFCRDSEGPSVPEDVYAYNMEYLYNSAQVVWRYVDIMTSQEVEV